VDQGLQIIDTLRSHSNTPNSVQLLWTSNRPDAETSTWQHTTLTSEIQGSSRQDSNPQYQQASCRRPTPYTGRPLRSSNKNQRFSLRNHVLLRLRLQLVVCADVTQSFTLRYVNVTEPAFPLASHRHPLQ